MLRTQHCFYFTSVDVLEASLRLVPVLQHEEELEAELPAGMEVAVVGEEELAAEQPGGVEVAVVEAEELQAALPAGVEVAVVGEEEELEAEQPAGVEVAEEELEAEPPAGVDVATCFFRLRSRLLPGADPCARFLEQCLSGLFLSHAAAACCASSTSWLSWN